jgi:hypothetical protein
MRGVGEKEEEEEEREIYIYMWDAKKKNTLIEGQPRQCVM